MDGDVTATLAVVASGLARGVGTDEVTGEVRLRPDEGLIFRRR